MANRNFKLREQDYKAMLDMTEKQAGQFIKGLCGYAFDGVPTSAHLIPTVRKLFCYP